MTRDNVTYLRPVRSEFRDYPDPFVQRDDLYRTLAEQERIARASAAAREDSRKMRRRAIAEVAALLLVAAFIGALLATGGAL